jgi:hypothetical protein
VYRVSRAQFRAPEIKSETPYFNAAGPGRQTGYFLFKAKKKVPKEMAQSRLPPLQRLSPEAAS